MQVTPFWGCMIPLKYPQMERAVRLSMAKIGVELVDDNHFSCCPDPIYFKAGDKLTWFTLAARNLALAEEKGHDLVTMCSGCTATLSEAHHLLEEPLRLSGGQHSSRTVSAHSPGIGSLIVVTDPFVVLGGGERQESAAITDRHERHLFSLQELLDHQPVTGSAKATL